MGLSTMLQGLRRGGGGTQEVTIGASRQGALHVAPLHLSHAELSRQGVGWSAMNTSALAALVVRPSTVANFTLFNNEPEGGLSYVMDRAFAFNLVSTAAEGRYGLWLCVHKKGLVSPTNDITVRASHRGRANYGGSSICDTAMTVTDDGWFPYGQTSDVEPTGVLPGGIVTVDLFGRLIVPPQCGISTQVVAAVTGETFTSGFAWFEMQLDLDVVAL